jgi:hypothetical protein
MDFLGNPAGNGNRTVLMRMAKRVTPNKTKCVMCKLSNKRKFLYKHIHNMSTTRMKNYTKAKRKATCDNEARELWGECRENNNGFLKVFKS